jgi:hypothetical protein
VGFFQTIHTAQAKKKSLAVEAMRKLFNDEIRSCARCNVVETRRFSERLEEAIARYLNHAISTVEYGCPPSVQYGMGIFSSPTALDRNVSKITATQRPDLALACGNCVITSTTAENKLRSAAHSGGLYQTSPSQGGS